MTILTDVTDGELTVVQAAELMGVCYRQGRRIWQRFQAAGDAGLVHRLRAAPSAGPATRGDELGAARGDRAAAAQRERATGAPGRAAPVAGATGRKQAKAAGGEEEASTQAHPKAERARSGPSLATAGSGSREQAWERDQGARRAGARGGAVGGVGLRPPCVPHAQPRTTKNKQPGGHALMGQEGDTSKEF